MNRARLDFDEINRALDPSTFVPRWLPDGKRVGNEWVARNPNRADRRPGSFTVNLATGAWADFALGDDARGGDAVSLYAYLFHGNDNVAAAKELARDLGIASDRAARPGKAPAADKTVTKIAQPEPILPVPDDVPNPAAFRHPKHGEPSAVWPYYDAEGRRLFFICRFNHEDGRKDICPLSWCHHPNGETRWTWRGITGTAKRPIYGLDRLAALPDADVLVVEGEKAAKAAQDLVGRDLAVVSWVGGTATAEKVDLRPLRGRTVFLWPDFDRQLYPDNHAQAGTLKPFHEQPGPKAMLAIAQGLDGIAASTFLVGYDVASDRFEPGWDLADAVEQGWKPGNVRQFLEMHAGPAFAVAGNPPSEEQAPTLDHGLTSDDEPVIEAANDNRPATVPLEMPLNPFGWPDMGSKGAPRNTIENLGHLLASYGIGVAYNVISKAIEIRIPGVSFAVDNRLSNALSMISSLCAKNTMPVSAVGDYVVLLADRNRRNPALDYIAEREWDGTDRIEELARTLDPHDPDLAALLLRRWLIGAAACALLDDGFAMQGMLVLQGGQGLGKTTWLRSLFGDRLDLFRQGYQINPADRDSVKGAISFWGVELGELDATFRKADISALKAFVDRQQDTLRLPYMRAESTFPRRTAFCASVNELQFLRDETGNRRYWVVRCGPGFRAKHGIDVQQVWAQALALFRCGEQHNLRPEELERLAGSNDQFAEASPIDELLRARFDWDSRARTRALTATEVLISLGYDKPNRQQVREAGVVLRKLTGGDPRKSNGRDVFDLPPRYDDPATGY